LVLGATVLALVAGAQGGRGVMESSKREAIVAAVRARMQSFEAAERARDPERLLAHNAPATDFQIYHDGRPGTYAALQAGVRGGLSALRSLDVTYSDLHVAVLSAEYALLSATFRRELVIASTGATSLSEGAVSYLWRNIDGQWLIVYAHISHPLNPAG
jgi:ketosteroid isomerase-like protein